jgi:hypothetical protein
VTLEIGHLVPHMENPLSALAVLMIDTRRSPVEHSPLTRFFLSASRITEADARKSYTIF